MGFTVEIINQDDVERAGHFFARHGVDPNGKRILLLADTNTMFEVNSDFQTFTRDGDRVTGSGVYDDKGGIIIMGVIYFT